MKTAIKQYVAIALIILTGSVFSQQRKVYRSGEAPTTPAVIKKESETWN